MKNRQSAAVFIHQHEGGAIDLPLGNIESTANASCEKGLTAAQLPYQSDNAARLKMQQYAWPGNVRELRNVVERAVALGHGPLLDVKDIWLSSLEMPEFAGVERDGAAYQALSLEDVEKKHIAQTLEHTDWNKSQAASILGIERSTLDRKIRAYNITKGA